MFRILKKLISQWLDDEPFTYSAAVSYYTLFSLPALVLILISISSFFLNNATFETKIYEFLAGMLGQEGMLDVKKVIQASRISETNGWMLAFGITLLLLASLRLFAQLQKALNHIWKSEEVREISFKTIIGRRLISLAVFASVGFTLLTSTLLTAILNGMSGWISTHFSESLLVLFNMTDLLLSFVTISALFTILMKFLPDEKVMWKSAAVGGLTSAVLFSIGEYILNYYFSKFTPHSAYGAASSFVMLMLWVSYSSLILFFGAQVSYTYQQYVKNQKRASAKQNAS